MRRRLVGQFQCSCAVGRALPLLADFCLEVRITVLTSYSMGLERQRKGRRRREKRGREEERRQKRGGEEERRQKTERRGGEEGERERERRGREEERGRARNRVSIPQCEVQQLWQDRTSQSDVQTT